MLAYKGFYKELTCTMGQGTFQYEPGRWYNEKLAHCARCGFHATSNPLDVLNYYNGADDRYFIVQLDGDIDEDGTDSRIAAPRIRLLRELTKRELYKDGAEWIIKHQKAEWPRIVKKDKGYAGTDENVIVRGQNPTAAGGIGAMIILLKENTIGRITDAGAYVIDGKDYKPGVYYDVEGRHVE